MENGLLYAGSEVQQVHDLRDAGAGDVAELSDLGLVADEAVGDHPVELDGQRHQPGDAGHPAIGGVLDRCGAGLDLPPALVGHREVDLLCHCQVVHASASWRRWVKVRMPVGWKVSDIDSFSPSYSTRSTSRWISFAR